MNVTQEALPADVHGLSDVARAALAAGTTFGPVPAPRSAAEIPRPAERLGEEERAALVDSIASGTERAGITLHPAAAERLEAMRRDGVPCVVTGQQPGFLTSPLYSLYKAIQACRLADELGERWGTPVAAVFWNHADDHDVAEVHHAWQLNRNLDLQKAALAGLSSGRVPLGALAVSAEAQRLDALRAQLDEAPPRPRRRHVPDLVRRRGRARCAERLDVARGQLTRHLRRARTGRRYSRRDSNPQSSP